MPIERSFKRAVNKIGIAMILFLIFMNLFMNVQSSLSAQIKTILPANYSYIATELLYGIAYLLSFLIPGFVIYAANRNLKNESSLLAPSLPSAIDTSAYIFASIAMILTMAIINSAFVSIFNYSEYSAEFLWGNEKLSAYQVILSFITSAIIPALAEEFLFRGAILSVLKPYGKAPAIIISALLFGLMHQNAEQLLYATAAGFILAFVVYETGSIWCSVLIHFFNNFIDIFKRTLLERLPSETAYPIYYIIEGGIFILGIISVVYLVSKKGKAKENEEATQLEDKIPPKLIAKNFFSSPSIIFFLIFVFIIMIFHIYLSLLYSALV